MNEIQRAYNNIMAEYRETLIKRAYLETELRGVNAVLKRCERDLKKVYQVANEKGIELDIENL